MKNLSLLLLSLGLSLSIVACDTTEQPTSPAPKATTESTDAMETSSINADLKRYGVESGSVTYELTGAQTGTKTISWKDWGMTERTEKESTISAAGVNISSAEVTIMKGEYMYTFNPEDRTGTKIKNTILGDLAKSQNNPDLGEVGMEILNATGAEKTGTETIAGETCDVYTIASVSTTTCVWKAINLKNESNLGGFNITELATNISTSTPDDALFEIPTDINFKDLGDIGSILKDL